MAGGSARLGGQEAKNWRLGRGEGYGKAILMGEHFVVHGARAIGMGIPKKTVVAVGKAPSLEFMFECGDMLREATRAILVKVAGTADFEVSMESELQPSAGMGWSASYCVALARAAAMAAGKELTRKEAAEIAFEGEKVFHGNPSGIDNMLAAFGGVMVFRKGEEPWPLKAGGAFHFVIANSGKKGPTKELVEKVAAFKEEHPIEFGRMMEKEEAIVNEAITALSNFDAARLGKLMDENHALLAELGLSTPAIEEIRRIALKNGALGAKITGAGGGGCVLILAPDEGSARQIAAMLGKYSAFGFSVV